MDDAAKEAARDAPMLTAEAFERLARERVAFTRMLDARVERLERGSATIRIPRREDLLRPGGTVAGPVMMTAADLAMYGAVMSLIGPVELAVTTNLNINFLRRPAPGDVLAEGSILKLGRRLAVGEVRLYTGGDPEMIAHVTATYSIPPGPR